MAEHRRNGRQRTDLSRHTAAIADRIGVRQRETLCTGSDEVRVVVEGGELARPMILSVRAGPGFTDTAARQAIVSEHLAAVSGVPQRGARGDVVSVRLDEYLPAPSLQRRLEHGPLAIGEAVTVLVAVCDVLHAAHRAGFGGIEPSHERIRFRSDGCPVLVDMGDVGELTATSAERDSAAFLRLVRHIASAVSEGGGQALLSRVERAMAAGGGGLREELLSIAPSAAVKLREARLHARGAGAAGASYLSRTSRARSGAETSNAGAPEVGETIRCATSRCATRSEDSRADGRARSRGAPSANGESLLDGDPVRAMRAVVGRAVRRRPKSMLAAAVLLVAGILVIAALPVGERSGPEASVSFMTSPDRTTAPSDAAEPRRIPPGSAIAGGVSAGDMPAGECGELDLFELTSDAPADTPADVLVGAAPLTEPACGAHPAADAPGAGQNQGDSGRISAHDDPGEAALLLLAAREGSRVTGADVEVVQRWGDAVLVRVEPDAASDPDGQPASLLMVRSEAGWQIRAVYS